MRCSRARLSLDVLAIRGRDEKAETEVAGESKGERSVYRLREAQFKQAAQRIRLCETALAAEAVEVQRAQSAAAEWRRRQLANFDDLGKPITTHVPFALDNAEPADESESK